MRIFDWLIVWHKVLVSNPIRLKKANFTAYLIENCYKIFSLQSLKDNKHPQSAANPFYLEWLAVDGCDELEALDGGLVAAHHKLPGGWFRDESRINQWAHFFSPKPRY